MKKRDHDIIEIQVVLKRKVSGPTAERLGERICNVIRACSADRDKLYSVYVADVRGDGPTEEDGR